MTTFEILKFLQEEIHTVVLATVDGDGLPVTCAVDIMDCDGDGLYFLTAQGKSLYRRLAERGYAALTGIKGADTMSRVAVTVRGRVREADADYLPRLLVKNPYMREIYPTEQSRAALTVFVLYEGGGEWFDLSKKPVERLGFTLGGGAADGGGYFITAKCTGCGRCAAVCPQGCIDMSRIPAVISGKNCLHCGNCLNVCPSGAVIR